MVKLPKPRISMRWPRTMACSIASRMALTAASASLWVSWAKRLASSSTRSERVMAHKVKKARLAAQVVRVQSVSDQLPLSSLARSRAPRLVVPALPLFCDRLAMASA